MFYNNTFKDGSLTSEIGGSNRSDRFTNINAIIWRWLRRTGDEVVFCHDGVLIVRAFCAYLRDWLRRCILEERSGVKWLLQVLVAHVGCEVVWRNGIETFALLNSIRLACY